MQQDDIARIFKPFEELATNLIPHAVAPGDGAHDIAHIQRVFANAMRIHAVEGGHAETIAGAVLLHDCVAVEKNSPLRAEASRLAAEKAGGILAVLGWSADQIARAAHAIAAHSFSAAIKPETLEAKILQDADRLDAIGLIGAARCFYTGGRMGSGLYDSTDPRAEDRALDDKRFSIDHFPVKLFKLADGFQTPTGRAMAAERHARLEQFYHQFLEEIG
ncbi:HD domain-containing protein [Rhizobium sp. KVB221]|uniref:HD domain-containing protein n=1 Tax=Rhizobium setariae TaxID=2801340 RepID=A0A936YLX2_9HYPH|nr:HD domain-containing protein [Rhizobium setariae]MBL0370571.1 HD domain-containing protein [Rhizobium setariae]